MINFNQSDSHDIKIQLEYLNNKPEYQEDNLAITNIKTKPFDFWNKSKIIEFKKRNCEHNRFPDFILQEDKLRINTEIANKHNITFLYQNKFSNGKVWEWNISKMTKENTLPKPIVKEMNHYTYVDNQQKVPKKVYMLTLAMGYEI
jgi:hypothetical protein